MPRLQNSVLCPLKMHEYICDSRPPADLVVHDSKNAQPSAFLNVQVSKFTAFLREVNDCLGDIADFKKKKCTVFTQKMETPLSLE